MNKNKSSANVVDGKLILSFPGAVTPAVWQMDLNEAKASALEIIDQDEEQASLVLKTPRGETIEVSRFTSRDAALKALRAVSKALENAHGQIRAAHASGQDNIVHGPTSKEPRGMSGWLAGLMAVGLIVVLLTIWNALAPSSHLGAGSVTASTANSPRDAVGVPLSADEYLRGQ